MKKGLFLISIALLFVLPIVVFIRYLDQVKSCPSPLHREIEIVKAIPRSENSFTQGFLFKKGFFYESFGQYGESGLKKYKPGSLNAILYQNLPKEVFGEGIAFLDDHFLVLSWKAQKGFLFDRDFSQVKTFTYKGEGWGLTSDGKLYIMSNGSSKLYFRSKEDFSIVSEVNVKKGDDPLKNLNELELIKGKVWANIWMSDEIAIINPKTGCVTETVDASPLWEFEDQSIKQRGGVINGIAYDKDLGHIYLSGKYFRYISQIKLK